MNRWKFVDTALLRVGYQEWNPSGQRTMVLMHGWPDSPRCWNPMVPALVSAGFCVIAPALRGFWDSGAGRVAGEGRAHR